jgi:hypothetical protein
MKVFNHFTVIVNEATGVQTLVTASGFGPDLTGASVI